MNRGASTVERSKDRDLQLIEEGRGQGQGEEYKPWLYAHQERGDCTTLRYFLPMTGRMHHLFSRKNIQYFMDLIFDETVTDIREYYALLPREETIRMAEEAGIRFPRYSESHDKRVLTFDFVVNRGDDITAIALHSDRTLNNLTERRIFQIQKLYCEKQGWELKVVNQNQLNAHRANNIRRVMMPGPMDANGDHGKEETDFLDLYFHSGLSIREAARRVEEGNGMRPGMGLHLFRRLVREKRILLNLDAGPIIYSTKGEIPWRNIGS